MVTEKGLIPLMSLALPFNHGTGALIRPAGLKKVLSLSEPFSLTVGWFSKG